MTERVRRTLPLTFGPDGKPVALDEVVQGMQVTEGDGWIGVDPATDLGLHPLGWASSTDDLPEG